MEGAQPPATALSSYYALADGSISTSLPGQGCFQLKVLAGNGGLLAAFGKRLTGGPCRRVRELLVAPAPLSY